MLEITRRGCVGEGGRAVWALPVGFSRLKMMNYLFTHTHEWLYIPLRLYGTGRDAK